MVWRNRKLYQLSISQDGPVFTFTDFKLSNLFCRVEEFSLFPLIINCWSYVRLKSELRLCDRQCMSIWYRHIGTNPMISSSLKLPVCSRQVLSALGTLFCDTHLYLGAGGYRLPLHISEEPLMRERQMCLYSKQGRGDGEWRRAMPRDPVCLPGGYDSRLHYNKWTTTMLSVRVQ